MHGEEVFLGLLVFGPGVLGVLLLGAAVWLLAPRKDKERSGLATGCAVAMLLASLGIGACYGMMFLG